jgi:hypothetical protein
LAEESSHHSISSKSSGQSDHPQPNSPDQQQSFENPAISEQQSTPIHSHAQENIESDQPLITSSPGQGEQTLEGNPAEKVISHCIFSDINILFFDELTQFHRTVLSRPQATPSLLMNMLLRRVKRLLHNQACLIKIKFG